MYILYILPDLDEEFSAEAVLDGFATGHDAFVRGNEDETTTRFNFRDFVGGDVDAATWFRNLFDFVDGSDFAFLGNRHVEDVARGVVDDFEIGEIASLFKSFDNGNFKLRGWEINFVLPHHEVVADAGQEVGDLISRLN